MSSVAAGHGGLALLYAALLAPEPPPEPAIDVAAIAGEAFEAGVAAGFAQAEAALQPERGLLKAAVAALTTATVVDIDSVRPVFLMLVRTLAETVVAAELRAGPEVLTRLVETALASVVVRDGLIVRLHPDDVGRVTMDLPVLADPTLARGEVSIDGPEFVIRDGLGARLAALVEAMA